MWQNSRASCVHKRSYLFGFLVQLFVVLLVVILILVLLLTALTLARVLVLHVIHGDIPALFQMLSETLLQPPDKWHCLRLWVKTNRGSDQQRA